MTRHYNSLSTIALHRNISTLTRFQEFAYNAMHNNTAFFCAFTSENSSNTIAFDTNSFAIVLDTGATSAFTHCMNDFTSFTPFVSRVEGLGSLSIQGIGTI